MPMRDVTRIFVNIIDHHQDQTQTQDENYKGPKADHPPLAKSDAATATETVVVVVVVIAFERLLQILSFNKEIAVLWFLLTCLLCFCLNN